MPLSRLKWTVIGAIGVFLAVLEYARFAVSSAQGGPLGRFLLFGAELILMFFFSVAVFSIFAEIQGKVERRNRELLALHHAGVDITAALSVEVVLQKVVDRARELLGARFGALALYREDGSIRFFLTSGMPDELRSAIGEPPVGRGLLGVVLSEGQRLRLADLASHPASAGFPPHHPPMRSLLAVPVIGAGEERGNLYVSEKEDASVFSDEDEETLVRFATQAAVAIKNAALHREVARLAAGEERLRIAHEMHDGLAQVLAYVNTKAQVVKELLRGGNADKATEHLDQLAGAAREVYGDVRESILGLRSASRTGVPLSQVIAEYIETWQGHQQIAVELRTDGDVQVPSRLELPVLRIVQEGLANVRKHAQAAHVRISVERRSNAIVVEVADDGVGFDVSAPRKGQLPRFGLTTMRERAESAGGRMEIQSHPGKGSRIEAWLPLQPGEA